MTPEEQFNFVFEKMKEGLTPQEMCDADPTKTLTFYKASRCRTMVIITGLMTREEANRYVLERKERKQSQARYETFIEKKKYTEKGYSLKEISIYTTHSLDYIKKIIAEFSEKDGWYSQEQLEQFEKARVLRTDEPEKNISCKEEKPKEKLQARVERVKPEDIESINELRNEYKIAKEYAQKEQGARKRQKAAPTEDRKRFLELAIRMLKAEQIVNSRDYDFIIEILTCNTELASSELIEAFIKKALKRNSFDDLVEITADFRAALEYTKYEKPLGEYMSWVRKMKSIPQIKKMMNDGVDKATIQDKLRISGSEIDILLSGKQIIPDLPEDKE